MAEPGFEPGEPVSRVQAVSYYTTHKLESWTLSFQCDETIIAGRTGNTREEAWAPF